MINNKTGYEYSFVLKDTYGKEIFGAEVDSARDLADRMKNATYFDKWFSSELLLSTFLLALNKAVNKELDKEENYQANK